MTNNYTINFVNFDDTFVKNICNPHKPDETKYLGIMQYKDMITKEPASIAITKDGNSIMYPTNLKIVWEDEFHGIHREIRQSNIWYTIDKETLPKILSDSPKYPEIEF